MLPTAVRDYISAHDQDFIARLLTFLRFPSIANIAAASDGSDACIDCANWLQQQLASLGFDAAVVDNPGGKPNVIAHWHHHAHAPTVMLYGHYDVQPPEPLAPWLNPPFQPQIRDGNIYARGANDNKGQFFAHLMAVEAWLKGHGELPVNITIFAEGEEEIGSPQLETFIRTHAQLLQADICLISDSEFFAADCPSITYSLRGLAYIELTLTGARADAHSGIHGGALQNPINALACMIAGMHDANGAVTLEGFYDDVLPLDENERRAWQSLPFSLPDYAASLGVPCLSGGEHKYSVLERRWARPTLDCNGIIGGYTEAGSKTIIPASATAKISMRLVAHQDPARQVAAFRRYVETHTPAGFTADIQVFSTANPLFVDPDSPLIQAAARAYVTGFAKSPSLIRCGASIPVAETMQRLLKLQPVLMGLGLPDDNLHSPNEKFSLQQLRNGAVTIAAMLTEIADGTP